MPAAVDGCPMTRCWRWAPRWRATPTTLPPRCSAGSRWPFRRRRQAGGGPPGGAPGHPGGRVQRAPGQLDPPHPRAAARDGAARRRRGERGRGRTAGARPDRRPVAYLLPATRDRLHQDYRAPAMPASAQLVADLRGGRDCRGDLRRRPVGDRAGHRGISTSTDGSDRVSRPRRSMSARQARRFTRPDHADTLMGSCSGRWCAVTVGSDHRLCPLRRDGLRAGYRRWGTEEALAAPTLKDSSAGTTSHTCPEAPDRSRPGSVEPRRGYRAGDQRLRRAHPGCGTAAAALCGWLNFRPRTSWPDRKDLRD